jgi:putative sugar O-methyltransferase
MLEERFNKFKKQIVDKKYGKFWEEAKKSFNISFVNSKFKNFGERDYFPEIYDEKTNKKDLVKIFHDQDYFYQKIGSQKLSQKKDGKNLTLLYANSYYRRIEKYIKNEQVVCEVGSGSGLLSSIINQNKKTNNILIDIPNVLLTAIALIFTLFPKKSFLLPNEVHNKEINFKIYDFVFLLPEQICLINNESIDFAINTQSFMEMDSIEVNNYLQFFNRVIKFEGYFFISNRLKKRHYFFNYKFNLLKHFKKIFLEKDIFFYNYSPSLSSMINLLLIKSKLLKKKDIHFNFFSKIFGIFYFKKKEFFYWLFFYIKKIFKFLLKMN